jgi:hypothetical protein
MGKVNSGIYRKSLRYYPLSVHFDCNRLFERALEQRFSYVTDPTVYYEGAFIGTRK